MKVSRWLPLIAVALVLLFVLIYVVANPLPANGYGRLIYDVQRTLTIPAGSSEMILMAEGAVVPSHSLVLVVAGVMNRAPDSDISETAYFRLVHAGTTIAEGDVSPFHGLFETRLESSGATNPALVIRNDHPFELSIDYRAFVTRPPSTIEHFALFFPVLVPLVAGAVLWAAWYGRAGRRSAQSM